MSLFFNNSKNDRVLKKLPVEKIAPNPYQPRKYFDENAINSLAESISRYGVIQPISVRQTSDGYELVAGERRLRAARVAGLSEIPCIIIKAGEKSSAQLAITENLQRCDLDIFEEAQALERLLSTANMTQSQLALELCMSQSAVANKLRLLRLDENTRQIVRKHGLSERHARALLRVPPEKRSSTAEKIGEDGMSVTSAEEYIDTILCTSMARSVISGKNIKKSDRPTLLTQKEQEPPEEKPIRRFLIGDLTLFYNSLDRSLSMLRSAGFDAELEKTEDDGKITLAITLKNAERRQ
jgi:ParB family chromosome partitioning protein